MSAPKSLASLLHEWSVFPVNENLFHFPPDTMLYHLLKDSSPTMVPCLSPTSSAFLSSRSLPSMLLFLPYYQSSFDILSSSNYHQISVLHFTAKMLSIIIPPISLFPFSFESSPAWLSLHCTKTSLLRIIKQFHNIKFYSCSQSSSCLTINILWSTW